MIFKTWVVLPNSTCTVQVLPTFFAVSISSQDTARHLSTLCQECRQHSQRLEDSIIDRVLQALRMLCTLLTQAPTTNAACRTRS